MNRLEADAREALDLLVEQTALRPDEERERLGHAVRTGIHRPGVGDEAAAADESRRQDLLDERAEMAVERDLREDRVPGLLETEEQPLADRLGRDVAALDRKSVV